jgi:hypothetical protein
VKIVCWLLFALSVLTLLVGVYSKFAGATHQVLGSVPSAWWRAAMALAIYAIALKLLGTEGNKAA